MGDEDEGNAKVAVHLLQFKLHIDTQFVVEGRERLVEKQHLGTVDDGTSNGHALLLSSREFVYVAFLVFVHTHDAECRHDTCVDFVLAHLLEFQAESHVVIDIKMRKESIALEHRVDGTLIGRQIGNVLAREQYLTFGRLRKTGNDAQQSGLAASRRTQEGHKFATLDVQTDIVEHHLIVVETLGDVLYLNNVVVVIHLPIIKHNTVQRYHKSVTIQNKCG